MTDKLKVVDFNSKKSELKNKEKEQWLKDIEKLFIRLKSAVEDDRLQDLIISWDEKAKDDEEHDAASVTTYYNDTDDPDRLLGYVQRLNMRIFLMTEGIVQGIGE